MTFIFDGPVIENHGEYDSRVWHERVKVICSHNPRTKQYEADVCWVKASSDRGYSVEQTAIFTDPFFTFFTEPVARFSANKFSSFCASVQAMCVALADDTSNVSGAAELLRKAQSFGLVKS